LKSDPRALLVPDVASELNLTDGQKQSLNALFLEMRGKIAGGNSDGLGFAARRAKVEEEYAPKVMEILTAEQKETLSKLKGSEFDVAKITPGGPRGGKMPAAPQRYGNRKGKGN